MLAQEKMTLIQTEVEEHGAVKVQSIIMLTLWRKIHDLYNHL